MWLRDCWYVIAWDHEIPSADAPTLFHRTVLGEPVLVYRTADGGFVALEDRCCHRLAPLSAGRREGDCVRCGYHGLKFAPDGRCIEIPGYDRIPPQARVRRYPIESRNRWLFVWMGDPAKADPRLLPDNFSCDHPDWKHLPGYLHYDTPYELICDNLLDFSHLTYVHEATLGGSPEIARSIPTVETVPGPSADWPAIGVKVSRHIPDVPAPPFYRRFRSFDCHLDRWFVYEFLLPGTLLMHSGGRPITDAKDDLSRAVRLHSCQTLTPETSTTTHYFFQQSHPAGEGDDTVTKSIYDSLITAFNEDRDMITAQYRNILTRPEAPMLPLGMDAALIRFRQVREARLAVERLAGDGPGSGSAEGKPR